jgi:hypothetical protein
MNKKYIYWGIGLLAIGGVAYFMMKSKKDESASTGDEVLDSSKVVPETNVKMPVKKLKVIEGAKSKIGDAVSGAKSAVKSVFKEKSVDASVDPRLAEAIKLRDEAEKIRLAKGFNNIRWRGALNGLRLNFAQQQFILGNLNTASTDEKLIAGQKALATAQRM